RARRQIPVSCNFCRSSKLRCSRGQPCTNCAARKIPCRHDYSVPPRTSSGPDPVQTEILERLRRLERAILPHHATPSTVMSYHFGEDACPSKEVPAMHADVAWLEQVSLEDKPTSHQFCDIVIFDIGPMSQVLAAPRYVFDPIPSKQLTRIVWLPERHEAKTIIQRYSRNLGYLLYVGFLPSLPAMVDSIYDRLDSQQPPQLGTTALFLSIIACTTFTWDSIDDDDIGMSPTETNEQAGLWARYARDVIEAANTATALSLELVQAMITLSFVIANLEGLALEFKRLTSGAIMTCQQLGIHLVDHPRNASRGGALEKEMKRRAWWYLVGTDWLTASRFDGQGDGYYQCSPCHMIVNQPLNINDEDFMGSQLPQARPSMEFTQMSFFLLRGKLADISRSFVDRNYFARSTSTAPRYADIIAFDAELENYLNDLPHFFKINPLDDPFVTSAGSALDATIIAQAYMLHMIFHHIRCRLHLPYLTADQTNPSHALSRQLCLSSARFILDVGNQVLNGNRPPVLPKRFCCSCCYNGFFLAGIVLLMEFCVNILPTNDAAKISKCRVEVLNAFCLLERAKTQSKNASRLLDSLRQLLKKHETAVPADTAAILHDAAGLRCTHLGCTPGGCSNDVNLDAAGDGKFDNGGKSGYFDEMAARMGDLMELDGIGLTDFLDSLDSSFF
ncbi:hypothetical protein B0J11DRAFT_594092, partial [Dendryphion nanum]